MGELTATGPTTVISEGFIAYGESNQSDGFGPRFELGRFDELSEAIGAARGKGVQGDPGSVSSFQVLLYGGGAVKTVETRLTDRRRVPDGSYLVGFLDLREYEYGARPADTGPVRPYNSSIFALNPYALGEAESAAIPQVDAQELRSLLLDEPGDWVGLWRKAGESTWRGEFSGSTAKELDRWLPPKRSN